jgi:hypothetical protein
MILIFAVMINYSDVAAENKEKYEEAQAELELAQDQLAEGGTEELLMEIAAAEGRAEAYEYLDNLVVIVNVSLVNKGDNRYRVLSYGIGSERGYSSRWISRDDETAFNKELIQLKDYLYRNISEAEDYALIYIVFSYDSQSIYGDDCDLLNEILREKTEMGDNIYFCENDTREG